MPIVRIFYGAFCGAAEVIGRVAEELGCDTLDDAKIAALAAETYEMDEAKLLRTLAGKVSAFDSFTHERRRNISRLKMTLAGLAGRENLVLTGAAQHLVPREISHVLSVCLIAEMDFRTGKAAEERGVSAKEAQKMVQKEDEAAKLWTEHLFRKSPWDADLYDILVPLSKTTPDKAAALILEHAKSDLLKRSPSSEQAVADFQLAARVELALGKEGHDVVVSADKGTVTMTINKHALMLSHLEDELKKIALKVEGVADVETKVGPGYYQSDVYRRFDFEVPSRVLLVDDEKEFVQTLSERLLMRDMGTAVVFDGEQALSFVEEETPDVIVLDLKMPGIDGIEVLRRIKREHPDIEVIILTGHGTETDRELCMDLGAFAYLQKPVDIEKLSATMREAYKKMRQEGKPD